MFFFQEIVETIVFTMKYPVKRTEDDCNKDQRKPKAG